MSIKTMNEDLMTAAEYKQYVMAECERQWNECQAETYGKWNLQSESTKTEYYNDMYAHLSDNLGKACCDCRYVAANGENLTCKCTSSENYDTKVNAKNYCNCMTE